MSSAPLEVICRRVCPQPGLQSPGIDPPTLIFSSPHEGTATFGAGDALARHGEPGIAQLERQAGQAVGGPDRRQGERSELIDSPSRPAAPGSAGQAMYVATVSGLPSSGSCPSEQHRAS